MINFKTLPLESGRAWNLSKRISLSSLIPNFPTCNTKTVCIIVPFVKCMARAIWYFSLCTLAYLLFIYLFIFYIYDRNFNLNSHTRIFFEDPANWIHILIERWDFLKRELSLDWIPKWRIKLKIQVGYIRAFPAQHVYASFYVK